MHRQTVRWKAPDRNFALQSWNSNRDSVLDQLNAANSLADREFNLYQTNLGQYNTDRNFALSQWDANRGAALDYLDAVMGLDNQKYNQGLSTWQNNLDLLGTQLGAYQGQEQTDYERRMEELNRVLQQQQLDYERKWNEDERDYNRAWNEEERDYNREWNTDERDYNRLWDQTKWDYSTQQDAQKLLQGQVDAMLQAGASIPSDMVSGSGYDPRYAQALEQYYKQQALAAAAKSSGSGRRSSGGSKSSSGSGSSGNGSSLAQAAMEWANKYGGDPEMFVKAYYKKYGYTNQSAALAALGIYQAENPERESGGSGSSSTSSYKLLNSPVNLTLDNMLRSGRGNSITSYLDSVWGKMSAPEQKKTLQYLNQYGIKYTP